MMNSNDCILIQEFVPKGPIDSKPTLAQVLAWGHIGANSFPEPMLTKTHNIIWGH